MNKLENIIAEYKAHTGKKGQMTKREMKLIEICFNHFAQDQSNTSNMVIKVNGPTQQKLVNLEKDKARPNLSVCNGKPLISKDKFREAMAIVEQYTAELILAGDDRRESHPYQIGCKVRLSTWGKKMQKPHNLIGTVIDYSPWITNPQTDGTVTVKWNGRSKPGYMHISQVEAVK